MSPRNRIQNARNECARGDEALNAARALITAGFFADSVTRSYYAAFHYALALLLSHGFEPKTHKGVVSLLGQEFVMAKRLDPQVSRLLSRLQIERHQADYTSSFVVTQAMAAEDLSDAETFIAAVKALLPPESLTT